MLQDKLEGGFYNRIRDTGKNCSLIVMHPKTWQDLVKEIINIDESAIYRYDPSLKYRGVKVLRSLDIVEGVFEVK